MTFQRVLGFTDSIHPFRGLKLHLHIVTVYNEKYHRKQWPSLSSLLCPIPWVPWISARARSTHPTSKVPLPQGGAGLWVGGVPILGTHRHPTHWAHPPQTSKIGDGHGPICRCPPNPATIFLRETWLLASRHLDLRSGCNPSTSFYHCQVRLAPPLKVQQSLSVNLFLSNILGCRSTHISNMSKWHAVLNSLWEQLRFPVFPGPWPHAIRERTSCICAPLDLAVAGLELKISVDLAIPSSRGAAASRLAATAIRLTSWVWVNSLLTKLDD